MIIRERLEQLIEKGATIYWLQPYGNSFIMRKVCLNKNIIGKNPITTQLNDIIVIFTQNNANYNAKYEELFETEKDARWELEMTATRTETLNLPRWEEFVKLEENYDYGYNTIKSFDDVKFGYVNPYNDKSSCLFIEKSGKTIYLTSMVTKENYIEACRLCKKLFLGEEI